MIIRPATSEDISAIVAIQQKNPQAAKWQESDYVRLVEDPSGVLLVAEDAARQVLGFAAAWRGLDEAELQNLAVDPQHRRQGVGQGLVHEVHCRLRAVGTKRVFLEVRPSNESALALYQSSGYTITGRRQNYYSAPQEDAFVLSAAIGWQ
jgi:[ribosomal protein S18]-alanine N-acetyltransferase